MSDALFGGGIKRDFILLPSGEKGRMRGVDGDLFTF